MGSLEKKRNFVELRISKRYIFISILVCSLGLVFLLHPETSHAGSVLDGLTGKNTNSGIDTKDQTNFGLKAIKTLVSNVRTIISVVAGSIAVVFIIIGGILFVTSAGNDQRVEQGKKFMTYAIGGLILVILAEVIIRVFAKVIGGGYS